jgi:fimbrial chaperone protein
MRAYAIRSLLCVGAIAMGSAFDVCAAEFAINPLRVTLSHTVKSAQIEIRNDDKRPLRVQIQAAAWSQDAEGKDSYVDSDALLYFPKAAEIPAGNSRIVRLAAKVPPASIEDTYRLFIQELPEPSEPRTAGSATVRILLRVGVPVFVEPLVPKAGGEIGALALHHGVSELAVSNTGNVHFAADRFAIVGLDRDGKKLFETPLQDRYFLAGTTKRLRAQIPREHCAQLATLEAVLVGSRIDLKRRLDVSQADCQ